MKISHLKLLRCPYCGHAFSVNHVFMLDNESIMLGSAYCMCEEFPILQGILYLHKSQASYILDKLRNHDYVGALTIALNANHFVMSLAGLFSLPLVDITSIKNEDVSESNFRWLWQFIFRQRRDDFDYYLHRNRFVPSLLSFFPLGYLSQHKKIIWLDIGPGIFTHYASILKNFPNITFVSIETNFLYQYLSSKLFSSQNTLRICADAAYGSFLKHQSVDLATFFDSLYCLPQQRATLRTIISRDLSKKGFIFASGLFEHAYFPLMHTPYYPISRARLTDYFKSEVHYFDNEKLSLCLKHKSLKIIDATIKKNTNFFRYCALWPKTMIRNPWSYTVPNSVASISTRLMTKPDSLWHNAVY